MKRNVFLILTICCAINFLVSCKTQNLLVSQNEAKEQQNLIYFQQNLNYEHPITVDDKISISVWGHDDLSVGSIYGIYNSNEIYGKWLLVDKNGNISIPKVGSFKVLGYTSSSLKDTLIKIYAASIINPVIDVKVQNKEISLLGELKKPGKFIIEKNNNTLFEMIAVAGDFDFYANKKKVKVIRVLDNDVKMITLDLTKSDDYFKKNIQLLPGDIVIVPSKSNKEFDRRITTIIPFASIITSSSILLGLILR